MRILKPVTITAGMVSAYDAANYMLMFDQVVGTRATRAESLTVTLSPGLIDSIAFLDVIGTSIDISMEVSGSGVVYTETIDLITKSVIIDWYTYFFEPIITRDAAVLLGIPPYGTAAITITVHNPGGTAEIGTLAMGVQKKIGGTQYNPQVSITDYSKKEVDVYGHYTILKRTYSKRMSCELYLCNGFVDELQLLLAAYRSEPVIWIGCDVGFSAMIIYGFYKNFTITIPYSTMSTCSLEIEGLS